VTILYKACRVCTAAMIKDVNEQTGVIVYECPVCGHKEVKALAVED